MAAMKLFSRFSLVYIAAADPLCPSNNWKKKTKKTRFVVLRKPAEIK
jgi:hypothetical protein